MLICSVGLCAWELLVLTSTEDNLCVVRVLGGQAGVRCASEGGARSLVTSKVYHPRNDSSGPVREQNSSSLLLETQEICVLSPAGWRFGATGEAGWHHRYACHSDSDSIISRIWIVSRPLSLAYSSVFYPSLYSGSIDRCMPRTSIQCRLRRIESTG